MGYYGLHGGCVRLHRVSTRGHSNLQDVCSNSGLSSSFTQHMIPPLHFSHLELAIAAFSESEQACRLFLRLMVLLFVVSFLVPSRIKPRLVFTARRDIFAASTCLSARLNTVCETCHSRSTVACEKRDSDYFPAYVTKSNVTLNQPGIYHNG